MASLRHNEFKTLEVKEEKWQLTPIGWDGEKVCGAPQRTNGHPPTVMCEANVLNLQKKWNACLHNIIIMHYIYDVTQADCGIFFFSK